MKQLIFIFVFITMAVLGNAQESGYYVSMSDDPIIMKVNLEDCTIKVSTVNITAAIKLLDDYTEALMFYLPSTRSDGGYMYCIKGFLIVSGINDGVDCVGIWKYIGKEIPPEYESIRGVL